MACLGGSSNVFKKALNAAEDNMNLINNVNFILSRLWRNRTWSIRLRISTELLDAASNSKTLKAKSSGSSSWLIYFSSQNTGVVFPTPRGPVNNNAEAK
jgi:hypothetical protein